MLIIADASKKSAKPMWLEINLEINPLIRIITIIVSITDNECLDIIMIKLFDLQ